MSAALVRVMAFRQEQERALRHFGVNDRQALDRGDQTKIAATHLPTLASGFAKFPLRAPHRLLPVRERLGERVRAGPLATQITDGAPPCLAELLAGLRELLGHAVGHRVHGRSANEDRVKPLMRRALESGFFVLLLDRRIIGRLNFTMEG
jgi:hypothetical protein